MRKDIPLIELKLENVTYAPVTVSAAAASKKGGKRKGRTTTTTTTTTKDAGNDNSTLSNGRQIILNNVSTTIVPYKLSAIMGPSGSGKTSLLSVASNLTKSGDLINNSCIKVNGEEGTIPKNLVGIVWQDDLLFSNLSVTENLYFAARLKTSKDISDDQVRINVTETMSELGLLHIQDSIVGSPLGPVRGISGGERKRVSVGIEMVERPSLLLLDEPTSGLDATTAYSLIYTLKELTKKGHSIAVVIHQPRTTIYNLFDNLLLLSKGYMIYNGHPTNARQYLESCPTIERLPAETGIADWIMDVVTTDENLGTDKEKRHLPKRWELLSDIEQKQYNKPFLHGSDEKQLQQSNSNSDDDDEETGTLTKEERRLSSLRELNMVPKYAIGFWKQLSLVTYRTVKQQRGERITTAALIVQVAYLFCTALFWWRIPNTTSRIFEKNSLFFFILIAQANGIVISAVTVFQRERTLLHRERAKKLYRVSSFFLAKTISDMSNNVFLAFVYGCIAYWTAGYRASFVAYLKFLFTYYWALSTAQSMGLFLSVMIPNQVISLVLAPPITLFFMILGGFYIPLQNMHHGIQWASYLSFARYSYSSMIVNEYSGRYIPCDDTNYTGSTTAIMQCPLPGEEVIESLGITGITQSYWFNVGMVILLQIFFRFAAYLALRRTK
jgi:ABC-type multidrug transport system ATPase subunit/ABC-type multidrug transport system permease subunit